jgi:hypothetical protein
MAEEAGPCGSPMKLDAIILPPKLLSSVQLLGWSRQLRSCKRKKQKDICFLLDDLLLTKDFSALQEMPAVAVCDSVNHRPVGNPKRKV